MNVLLVDDEQTQLALLRESCEKVIPGAVFLEYTDPVKAFREHGEDGIDLAFLDIRMPELDGIALGRKLKERHPETKIIYVTAHEKYALDAFRIHATGFIVKPVDEEKIAEEVRELWFMTPPGPEKKLQVKCFGNFEIFHDGAPLKFKRSKSKELLAYLFDREGVPVGVDELGSILWEEERPSYLRNLIGDIRQTLGAVGCEDVFIKGYNAYSVDISKVECDAYAFKNGDPSAIRAFRGEYMSQYSWPMFADD